MKKTNHQLTVEAGRTNKRENVLNREVVEVIFRPCPFCGNMPDVFQVPESRYGENSPLSWTIDCLNMGCIFTRPETGDQSLKHLSEMWNGLTL